MRKLSLDAALATLALACAGATGLAACDGGSGKGAGGNGGAPGAPYGSGNGGAVTVTGIPAGTTTTTPHFPGAGTTGSPPLAPGCTPASAKECPTVTGNCNTSKNQKVEVKGHGADCYYGSTTTTTPEATLEYIHEVVAGQDYYRFRLTFDPAFVDNTFGENAIGWGTTTTAQPPGGMMGMMMPKKGGHTFNDLVGSDHAEMLLADAAGKQVMDVKIDYITADASRPCGFGTLGVAGGEGKVLIGDASWVLAASSSIDRNLNGCGYCMNEACSSSGSCTTDSPATDANYTPDAKTPGWDYRVQYEIWVSAAAFGSAGFGAASITFVHASPSKASSNTVTVLPRSCPPHWDVPYTPPGNNCPAGYVMEMDEFGHVLCRKPGTYDGGTDGGTDCPTGYTAQPDEFGGYICVPPGGGTPVVP